MRCGSYDASYLIAPPLRRLCVLRSLVYARRRRGGREIVERAEMHVNTALEAGGRGRK